MCNAGYIILEQKVEFIPVTSCEISNKMQKPTKFIVGDTVWDTNPVIFLIVYQLYTIQMEPYNALTFPQHTLT